MAECAQCKAPLESEFGFVVCPKCGYTNVLGVEFTPPEPSSFSSSQSPVTEGAATETQEAVQVPPLSESSGVTGDPHMGKELGAAFVAQVVEQSDTQSESLFSESTGAESLIEPTTTLQFRLELYDLDVRALESRVYAIVESLRLEEFWQADPRELGRFVLSPLSAHQLSWLLLRLEGVHDKWKVIAL